MNNKCPVEHADWKRSLAKETWAKAVEHSKNAWRMTEAPPALRLLKTKMQKLSVNCTSKVEYPPVETIVSIIDDLLGGGLNEQEVRHLLLKGL